METDFRSDFPNQFGNKFRMNIPNESAAELIARFSPKRPKRYAGLYPHAEFIRELRRNRASYDTIVAILRERHGLHVSDTTVRHFCRDQMWTGRKSPRWSSSKTYKHYEKTTDSHSKWQRRRRQKLLRRPLCSISQRPPDRSRGVRQRRRKLHFETLPLGSGLHKSQQSSGDRPHGRSPQGQGCCRGGLSGGVNPHFHQIL